jgi:hypothetical protein
MAANSTLMFSGFNPNSRNSSKVLRPPGGGASDIFGLNGQQEEDKKTPMTEDKTEPVQEDKTEPVLEDKAEPVQEPVLEDKTVPMYENENIPPIEESTPIAEDANATIETTKENIQPSIETPAEVSATTPLPESSPFPETPSLAPPVAGVRGRVPPGGHSSGSFW